MGMLATIINKERFAEDIAINEEKSLRV